MGANIYVNDGDTIEAGDVIAARDHQDQGYHRRSPLAWLTFEARKPRTRSFPRNRRHRLLRQGHQGQAQGGHHARKWASPRST